MVHEAESFTNISTQFNIPDSHPVRISIIESDSVLLPTTTTAALITCPVEVRTTPMAAVPFPNEHNFVFPVKDLENDLVKLTPFNVRRLSYLCGSYIVSEYLEMPIDNRPHMVTFVASKARRIAGCGSQ